MHQELLPLYSRSQLLQKTQRPFEAVILFLSAEITRRQLQNSVFDVKDKDIAKTLNVSIHNVRRAWEALKEDGVCQVRQGVGVLILDYRPLLPDKDTIEAYFDIRERAETELARLGAINAPLASIDRMRAELHEQQRILQKLEKLDSRKQDQFEQRTSLIFELFEHDIAFHAHLRDTSVDGWLSVISEIAGARTQLLRLLAHHYADNLQRTILGHEKILNAIEEHDRDDAAKAVKEHLDIARHFGLKVLKEWPPEATNQPSRETQ